MTWKRMDRYSGGVERLKGLWPFERFTKNHHEHLHADGGYYLHQHANGDTPHEHESKSDRMAGQDDAVRRSE